MTTHVVKCQPVYWRALKDRSMQFNARLNDRFYQKGDIVVFSYYDPVEDDHELQGQVLERRITCILQGGNFGIENGYCILGLAPLLDDVDSISFTDKEFALMVEKKLEQAVVQFSLIKGSSTGRTGSAIAQAFDDLETSVLAVKQIAESICSKEIEFIKK